LTDSRRHFTNRGDGIILGDQMKRHVRVLQPGVTSNQMQIRGPGCRRSRGGGR
jgi:hypothetical protein